MSWRTRIMNERQRAEFAKELECNFSLAIPDLARYRVNVFVQQLNVGMVIRTIPNEMPSFEQLGLPETFKEIVMTKRGMVLVVGATGSRKIDLARRHDRSSQPLLAGPHHHDRGSGRIHSPIADVAGHASRRRHRHALPGITH